VYVLASHPNTILRIDPTDGSLLGQVTLQNRSGRFGVGASTTPSFQGLRARMVVNPSDERLFVTLPEAGSLSIVSPDLFPALDHDVPWVQAPEAPVVAAIPGVVRPAAPPLPSQPAPVLLAGGPSAADSTSDQEAN
jgi:hypothetical protein